MTTLRFCFGVLLLASAVGCTNRSSSGGGSERATKFDLAGPNTTTSIKQGETQTVAVKIERGKEFTQPIALKAESPAGVSTELSSRSNQPSDKGEVNLMITASEVAPVGEHVIHLIATPDNGNATALDVKIKVVARPEAAPTSNVKLSLTGPHTTTIKQGETKTIDINLKQSGNKYPGNVRLNVENRLMGITTEFTSNTIRATDSGEVGLKITADKTAEIGEHTLRITGTPDTGIVTPVELKLKVVAP